MANLPIGNYNFYAGIDPGFTGAIAVINAAGTTVRIWDMPILTRDKDRQREMDLDGLAEIFRRLQRRPKLALGLEWPTTRPGEGAERSERFGRGKGYLHAYAHILRLDYYLIAPNLWKGRLGIPGKVNPDANKLAARVFKRYYPEHADQIRGPRGGIKHGRCDAALIAHFLRTRNLQGMQSIADRFGKGSDEAFAHLFRGRTKYRGIT